MKILREVRDFLAGLRGEFPELARERRAPAREGVRGEGPEESLLRGRVEHWSGRTGIAYRRLRVRDMRSRWGSCSAAGNLSLNLRLAFAPVEVVDYVVVHELAHRVHLDHSKRFWAVVERWCPEHKKRRKWLRENGERLLRTPLSRLSRELPEEPPAARPAPPARPEPEGWQQPSLPF